MSAFHARVLASDDAFFDGPCEFMVVPCTDGAMGILPPATSALLHNASTLGVSLKIMTNLLD